jgi:M6 family metalloprotease-like protein
VLVLLGLLGASAPTTAQEDVELLGRLYGATPPAAYYEQRAADPTAFEFSGAWFRRNARLEVDPERGREGLRLRESTDLPLARSFSGPGGLLGREDPVEGSFILPVVLGRFSDTQGAAESSERIQREYFDGPSSRSGTVVEYYEEISGGRVTLTGETFDWVESSLTQTQATGGRSVQGLASGTTGVFIVDLLENIDDGSIDWGRFDNDGPDGIPNSGDDDGAVDILAVLHPTPGAECGGGVDRIWSHRWSLAAAAGLFETGGYVTSSPAAGGGTIRVNDYVVQPSRNCQDTELADIGVLAHELGHGFGLPDLYCTGRCSASGVGNWGLMGTGSWGCRSQGPEAPCHMGAWSKEVLGWADVETVPAGRDLGTVNLEPVVTGGRILRIDIPGTSQYFLIENRQRLGFDADVRPGLLIWKVDEARVIEGWPSNRVNGDPQRFGVSVVQPDGEGDLEAGRNRGDDGDVFPGASGQRAFHAGTSPAAVGHDGTVSGLTLMDLDDGSTELRFRLLTRFQSVEALTSGDGGTPELLRINGTTLPVGGGSASLAPFEEATVVASSGAAREPGVRTPFLRWADGVTDTVRSFTVPLSDTAFVAEYAGRQLQVAVGLQGEAFGVAPGTVSSQPTSPGLWFEAGTAVTLEARPTPGFVFNGWAGELEGAPNPVGFVVEAPVFAEALFDMEFSADAVAPLSLAAGDEIQVDLTTTDASEPVRWEIATGALPWGVILSPEGRLTGSPSEHGSFEATLRARDALGLEGTVPVRFEISVPELALEVMAADLLADAETGELTPGQAVFLDRSGNRNGTVDIGDIRVYQTSLRPLGTQAPAKALVRTLRVKLGRRP